MANAAAPQILQVTGQVHGVAVNFPDAAPAAPAAQAPAAPAAGAPAAQAPAAQPPVDQNGLAAGGTQSLMKLELKMIEMVVTLLEHQLEGAQPNPANAQPADPNAAQGAGADPAGGGAPAGASAPTSNPQDMNSALQSMPQDFQQQWQQHTSAILGTGALSQSQLDEHHQQVYSQAIASGSTPQQALQSAMNDPLVFDLNGDGKTDATVNQHGTNVDGDTSTKWAAKGDGVLAFGDTPLGTEHGKFADAYANLRARAKAAGIDTSKGYLDKGDIAKLEAKGLTMLVSRGDGTNDHKKPSELGITRIDLGGRAANGHDAAGNAISSTGAFVRNGETHTVNDMWLKHVS